MSMLSSAKKYFGEVVVEYGKLVEMNGRTWRF